MFNIKQDGQQIHIGTYSNKHFAALAFNEKSLELRGEFANLNIVPQEYVIAYYKQQFNPLQAEIERLTLELLNPNKLNEIWTNTYKYSIYNLIGEKIHFSGNELIGEQTVNLNDFPNGVYIVRITVEGQVISKKIHLRK